MTWRIVGSLAGEDVRLVVADDGATDPPDARTQWREWLTARSIDGPVLRMTPVGPFVDFDEDDDRHLAFLLRSALDVVDIDTGPEMVWPEWQRAPAAEDDEVIVR